MYSLYKANLLAGLSCYTHVWPKTASGWLWVLLVVEAISVLTAESRGSNQNKGVGGLGSLEKVSTDSLCPSSIKVMGRDVRWVEGTTRHPGRFRGCGAEH